MIIVSTDFPPEHGGIQRYALRLAEENVRAGNRSIVIAPSPSSDLGKEPYNFTVLRAGHNRILGRQVGLFLTYLTQLSYARASYTVATLWMTALPIVLLPKHLRGPLAILVHGSEVAPSRMGLRKRLQLFALKRADFVIANSNFTAGLLRDLGVQRKIDVIYCGVDQKDHLVHQNEHRTTILSIGRLVKRKGFDAVLRAVATLRKEVPFLRYELIGDGPERSRLEALAAQLNILPFVTFRGAVSDEEIDAAYARAICFAMPCRSIGDDVEGFGIVYLEAGIASVPSIGGVRSGAAEAIGESGGILVNGNDDDDELVSAIRTLVVDEGFRKRLGSAARDHALKLSWRRTAHEIDKLCRPLSRSASHQSTQMR